MILCESARCHGGVNNIDRSIDFDLDLHETFVQHMDIDDVPFTGEDLSIVCNDTVRAYVPLYTAAVASGHNSNTVLLSKRICDGEKASGFLPNESNNDDLASGHITKMCSVCICPIEACSHLSCHKATDFDLIEIVVMTLTCV